ncbi:MAG: hypothetical protein ACE148_07745 [Vicinamibacterales bacterium]
MHYRQLGSLTLVVAFAAGAVFACGDGSKSPSAPDGVGRSAAGAVVADNPTLKASVPVPRSPSGQLDTRDVTLVADPSTGTYVNADFSYRFEVQENGAAFDGALVKGTSYVVKRLGIDKSYRWRIRAEYEGRYTAWSNWMTFSSPKEPEGYINAQEVFDPLTNGRTVGEIHGPVEWIPNVGVKLLDHTSHITYRLPQTLEAGEFSILATGFDEGSPGDKTKIMSMQEGDGDITSNDYRFTVEKRGSSYVTPGAVVFRIITGDAGAEHEIHDSPRRAVSFSDELWYFWRAQWQTGMASLELKEGSRSGPVLYEYTLGTGTHPYRPNPHVVHLGAPVGRAGPIDATVPGLTIKNVWISNRPRPADLDR